MKDWRASVGLPALHPREQERFPKIAVLSFCPHSRGLAVRSEIVALLKGQFDPDNLAGVDGVTAAAVPLALWFACQCASGALAYGLVLLIV